MATSPAMATLCAVTISGAVSVRRAVVPLGAPVASAPGTRSLQRAGEAGGQHGLLHPDLGYAMKHCQQEGGRGSDVLRRAGVPRWLRWNGRRRRHLPRVGQEGNREE